MTKPNLRLFTAVQTYLSVLGFHSSSQPNQICAFTRTNGYHTCTLAGMIIPSMGFFIFKAQSAYDYSSTFFISITMISGLIYLTVVFYKMNSIRNLIVQYQEIIEKRKWLIRFESFDWFTS